MSAGLPKERFLGQTPLKTPATGGAGTGTDNRALYACVSRLSAREPRAKSSKGFTRWLTVSPLNGLAVLVLPR